MNQLRTSCEPAVNLSKNGADHAPAASSVPEPMDAGTPRARRASSRLAATAAAATTSRARLSPWLAPNPAKRWAELFFLAYSPTWIVWCLCILVPFKIYESLGKWGYMSLGLAAALPCALLPLALQPASERAKPLAQRYWVKANAWIAVFSFVGNYFWTHYFYRVLGASYTFPAHQLNQVEGGRGGGGPARAGGGWWGG